MLGHNAVGATAVARPAARWILLPEIPPDEYAAALLGVGIVGNQAKTPFALVAEGLEFRHQVADAGLERLRRHDDCDAAVLVPFNGSRLFKIRQQHLADPGRYAGGVGERLGGRGAFLALPGGERGLKPLQMPHAWAALRLKVLVDFKVGGVEQENAVRRAAVATRATDLLNILLQGSGSLVMQDVADVRLVDAHAEGGCCDHDQAPGRHS